jgi:galactose-1-phosphate uridylyltransferase
VRWDPLTGRSARLLTEGSLQAPNVQDLDELAEQTRPTCPFCAERIERETPRFPTHVRSDGRIRSGEAFLFPNLVPYAKWSCVSVYSPARHLLRIDELSTALLRDNLIAQVEFGRTVIGYDAASSSVAINANHLPPSGSSIFHPHLQGSANPVPTTSQRAFAELPPERVHDYLELENQSAERLIGSADGVTWLASFAPAGPAEVRGLIPQVGSVVDLETGHIEAIANGLSNVLRAYDELDFQSFNLAIHGLSKTAVIVRVAARATFGALHRSDVMWSEHLQEEAVTDLSPERVAATARRAFMSG